MPRTQTGKILRKHRFTQKQDSLVRHVFELVKHKHMERKSLAQSQDVKEVLEHVVPGIDIEALTNTNRGRWKTLLLTSHHPMTFVIFLYFHLHTQCVSRLKVTIIVNDCEHSSVLCDSKYVNVVLLA